MAKNIKAVRGPAPLPVSKAASPLYKGARRVSKGVGIRDLVSKVRPILHPNKSLAKR